MSLYQVYLSGIDGRVFSFHEAHYETDEAALGAIQHDLAIGTEAELWRDTRRIGLVKSARLMALDPSLDRLEVERL